MAFLAIFVTLSFKHINALTKPLPKIELVSWQIGYIVLHCLLFALCQIYKRKALIDNQVQKSSFQRLPMMLFIVNQQLRRISSDASIPKPYDENILKGALLHLVGLLESD